MERGSHEAGPNRLSQFLSTSKRFPHQNLLLCACYTRTQYGEDVSFPAHNLGSYLGRLVHDEDQDFLFGMPQRRRTFPPSSLYAYVAIEEWRRIGSGVGFCA